MLCVRSNRPSVQWEAYLTNDDTATGVSFFPWSRSWFLSLTHEKDRRSGWHFRCSLLMFIVPAKFLQIPEAYSTFCPVLSWPWAMLKSWWQKLGKMQSVESVLFMPTLALSRASESHLVARLQAAGRQHQVHRLRQASLLAKPFCQARCHVWLNRRTQI